MLFFIYIPTINADEAKLNMLIASMGGLFQLATVSRISISKCKKKRRKNKIVGT